MGFLGDLISERVGAAIGRHSTPEPQHYASQPNPNDGLPPGWVARWADDRNTWVYVEEQTGRWQWERPAYYGGGGGGGYQQEQYVEQQQQPVVEEKKDHTMLYAAGAGVAGLAAGALLMHEGEEIKEDWDQDKYAMQQEEYRVENDVEYFPENAAGWVGDKVGEVESIPQNIEQDWDNAEQDVEYFPENAAGWVGDKVGAVEGEFDAIDNSYDAGRAEGRMGEDYY
ncbi:WW domain protein [Geopyxis carbonaria]|nr:WW domain protein [Geopyxis carbonaria]